MVNVEIKNSQKLNRDSIRIRVTVTFFYRNRKRPFKVYFFTSVNVLQQCVYVIYGYVNVRIIVTYGSSKFNIPIMFLCSHFARLDNNFSFIHYQELNALSDKAVNCSAKKMLYNILFVVTVYFELY